MELSLLTHIIIMCTRTRIELNHRATQLWPVGFYFKLYSISDIFVFQIYCVVLQCRARFIIKNPKYNSQLRKVHFSITCVQYMYDYLYGTVISIFPWNLLKITRSLFMYLGFEVTELRQKWKTLFVYNWSDIRWKLKIINDNWYGAVPYTCIP